MGEYCSVGVSTSFLMVFLLNMFSARMGVVLVECSVAGVV